MDVRINVVGQKLKILNNYRRFVDGSHKFIRFIFTLDSSWKGLTTYAQFTQNGSSYNVYLDEKSSVYMPHEITAGKCSITICGTANGIVATTDSIVIDIDESALTSGEESTDITESLYEQLVDKVDSMKLEFATRDEVSAYLEGQTYDMQNWIDTNYGSVLSNYVVGISGSGTYRTSDKTYSDIYNTLASGKYVVAVDSNGKTYPYVGTIVMNSVSTIAFGISATYDKTTLLEGFLIMDIDNTTIVMYVNDYTPLYSTDDIDAMIGDIETLLANI